MKEGRFTNKSKKKKTKKHNRKNKSHSDKRVAQAVHGIGKSPSSESIGNTQENHICSEEISPSINSNVLKPYQLCLTKREMRRLKINDTRKVTLPILKEVELSIDTSLASSKKESDTERNVPSINLQDSARREIQDIPNEMQSTIILSATNFQETATTNASMGLMITETTISERPNAPEDHDVVPKDHESRIVVPTPTCNNLESAVEVVSPSLMITPTEITQWPITPDRGIVELLTLESHLVVQTQHSPGEIVAATPSPSFMVTPTDVSQWPSTPEHHAVETTEAKTPLMPQTPASNTAELTEAPSPGLMMTPTGILQWPSTPNVHDAESIEYVPNIVISTPRYSPGEIIAEAVSPSFMITPTEVYQWPSTPEHHAVDSTEHACDTSVAVPTGNEEITGAVISPGLMVTPTDVLEWPSTSQSTEPDSHAVPKTQTYSPGEIVAPVPILSVPETPYPPRFREDCPPETQKYVEAQLSNINQDLVSINMMKSEDIDYVLRDGEYVKLGSGGFADVYLGRLKRNSQLVAIKINKIYVNIDDFINECAMHHKVNDPPVTTQLHGIACMEKTTTHMEFAIISEFVGDEDTFTSQTLANMIHVEIDYRRNNNRSSLVCDADWLRLCIDIVRCVQYVHRKHVVVNDIKSNNILVKKKDGLWIPLLIDFGIAGTNTCSHPCLVKPEDAEKFLLEYRNVAPEMVYQRQTTAASDIYSVGSVLQDICKGSPNLHLERVITLCRSADPDNRFTADELLAVLEFKMNAMLSITG